MKKSRNFLILTLSMIIITVSFVAPTFSWLSSQSDPVVNTFAGGKIEVIVDESKVDEHGKIIFGGGRVYGNKYKYVAGSVLDKDPTPTVIAGSESCYVFLCVENELTDMFRCNYDTTHWYPVATEGNKTLYVYYSTVDASEAETDVMLEPIFTQVEVSKELTPDEVEALGTKMLNVTAYAVQTEALTSQAAIDLAAAQFMSEGTDVEYFDIAVA